MAKKFVQVSIPSHEKTQMNFLASPTDPLKSLHTDSVFLACVALDKGLILSLMIWHQLMSEGSIPVLSSWLRWFWEQGGYPRSTGTEAREVGEEWSLWQWDEACSRGSWWDVSAGDQHGGCKNIRKEKRECWWPFHHTSWCRSISRHHWVQRPWWARLSPGASLATGLLLRIHIVNLVRLFFRNLSERRCCGPRTDRWCYQWAQTISVCGPKSISAAQGVLHQEWGGQWSRQR